MKPYVEFFQGMGSDVAGMNPAWLGGKGFGLVEMAQHHLPVPPGFVIPTGVHKAYLKQPEKVLEIIRGDVEKLLARLAARHGYAPLLSVRSGAPVSMPGMMDTVLNVGLTAKTMPAWTKRLGETAAWDCRRRLVTMFATVVRNFDKARLHKFEAEACASAKVDSVSKLTPMQIHKLCSRIEVAAAAQTPATVVDQVVDAVEAVFCSWMGARAIEYRRLHDISDDMGTAVVVQAMVFGNMNERSATGVLFTRDPASGAPGVTGEFLVNAQGEDVVAGTHKPNSFTENNGAAAFFMPNTGVPVPSEVCAALTEMITMAKDIEAGRADMQDIEFTIEDGKLWLLQTRAGKRSATAAFRIAMDMIKEGKITEETARTRVTAKQFSVCRRPLLNVDKTNAACVHAGRAIGASNGCAVGRVAFTASQVAHYVGEGDPVILVRRETTPDDIALMAASTGILTATGGFTSHAAVVARGMDKVCVTGWEALQQTPWPENFTVTNVKVGGADTPITSGDWITLDGETGDIWLGKGVVEDGNADEAEKFVARLARAAGIKLVGSDYVSLIDAMEHNRDPVQWADIAGVMAMTRPGLIIDLRGPEEVLSDIDMAFLKGLGAAGDTERQRYVNAQHKAAKHISNFDPSFGVRVILPTGFANEYLSNKLNKVPLCQTVDEALTAKGDILMSPRMRDVIGSGDVADLLINTLVDRGVRFLAEPMTLDEAATRLLA